MINKKFAPVFASLLSLILLLAPVASASAGFRALHRAVPTSVHIVPSEDEEEATTIDELFASGSYGVYLELRDYGYQVRSGSISEILEPLAPLLSDVPKELTKVAMFSLANSAALERSRVVFATEKGKASYPEVLFAVELQSKSDAIEFEPKLKDLIVSLLAPTVAAATGGDKKSGNSQAMAENQIAAMVPYFLKRMGRLLVISEKQFKLKDLRPDNSGRLVDDPNFRSAHDHLSTDAAFLYVDLALMDRVSKEKADEYKKAQESLKSSDKKAELEAPAPPTPPPAPKGSAKSGDADVQVTVRKAGEVPPASGKDQPQTVPGGVPGGVPGAPPPQSEDDKQIANFANTFVRMMTGYGSVTKWPDAFAVGLAMDGSEIGLRLWIPTAPGTDVGLIPFIPLLIAGPTLSTDAASILPADTEMMVSGSLNWPRMYDKFIEVIFTLSADLAEDPKPKKAKNPAIEPLPDAEVAEFEKKYGFKIRDELLTAIGSEVTIGFSAKAFTESVVSGTLPSMSLPPDAIFLISINDKDLLKKVLPKALVGLGLTTTNEKASLETYKEHDIKKYKNGAMTIINDYLVLAPDVKTIKHVIDSKAQDQTLVSNERYNSAVRGLPPQRVAQVYVSNVVMKELFKHLKTSGSGVNAVLNGSTTVDDEVKDFFNRYNPDPLPIVHAVSADGQGTLHQLRLPKSLITMLGASTVSQYRQSRVPMNEIMATSNLRMLKIAEEQHKIDKASYATLDILISEKLVNADSITGENAAYSYEIKVNGDQYEISAVPVTYGKTGKKSFLMNEQGVLRGADHNGSPATASDPKLEGNDG
jgi:hypothetical protein